MKGFDNALQRSIDYKGRNDTFRPIPTADLSENNSQIDDIELSASNHNNYVFHQKYNIKYTRIGNCIAFGFDKDMIPKYIIGPHWYLFTVMQFVILGLCIFLYNMFLYRLSIWLRLLFILLMLIVYGTYFYTFIINPGVVLNKEKDDVRSTSCSKCGCFYDNRIKVSHCNFCGVCIEYPDHHCVWTGKCIGGNNKFSFYSFIISVGIAYTYLIICVIFACVSDGEIKRK